ncbi:MAG TPA: ribosomal protein L13e [Nitrososphaeraceae archaeon]|nr:ribosomal protein L13e [Nitrososphaeraceae archaeon]
MKRRINKPIIKHSVGDIELIRRGRGFSRSELKDSGLNNIKIARKNGIPVDMLRNTKYPENIEQLKPIVREILNSQKPAGKGSKRT